MSGQLAIALTATLIVIAVAAVVLIGLHRYDAWRRRGTAITDLV